MAAYSLPVPMVALVTSGGGWARGTSGSRQDETPAPWILREGQRVTAPQPLGLQEPQILSVPRAWGASPQPAPLPPALGEGREGRHRASLGQPLHLWMCWGGFHSPPCSCPCPLRAGIWATLPTASPATLPTQMTLGHPSTTVPTRPSLLLPPCGDGNANDQSSCSSQDLHPHPSHLLRLNAAWWGLGRALPHHQPPVTQLLSLHCTARATPHARHGH